MAAAKPKIDLKARLGRKSVGPASGPAPGAAAPGSMAPGSAPPSGMPGPGAVHGSVAPAPSGFPASGIPGSQPAGAPVQSSMRPVGGVPGAAPGFGGAQQQVRPGVSSIPAPPGFGPKQPPQAAAQAPVQARPVVQTQAIRVDMSDEVVEAQRRGRSKIAVLAAVTAIIGGLMGFGMGQLVKGNEGAKAAVEGAGLLVKEVSDANTKANELNELYKEAAKKVRAGKFPSEEIEKLGAVDIPFDGTNLTNKGIGRYNATAMTLLLQYSAAVADAKDQKDKIRRLFGAAKPTFDTIAAEKEKPNFHWGVSLTSTPMGPVASVLPIKPVPIQDKEQKSYRWPGQFETPDGKKKLDRFTGGDPFKGDPTVIPVDPDGESAVCPQNLQFRLMGALVDASRGLQGDDTPGHEKAGVLTMGDKLLDQLRKIGSAG